MEPNEGSHRILRVLELYSGIGGMHCALNRCFAIPSNATATDFAPSTNYNFSATSTASRSYSTFPYDSFRVVAAVDVNETAAAVYRHNFPSSAKILRTKGVEGFTLADLRALRFDMVTMSPPCQPFTRQGLKKDEDDARTKSLFHFLRLFEQMATSEETALPKYILIENVMGFEGSSTRNRVVDTIRRCGFRFQEFLLTPTQFGIPNSRLRYYLIGKKEDLKFCFPLTPSSSSSTTTDVNIMKTDIPTDADAFRNHKSIVFRNSRAGGGDYRIDNEEPAKKRVKSTEMDDAILHEIAKSNEITAIFDETDKPVETTTNSVAVAVAKESPIALEISLDPISYFLDEETDDESYSCPDNVLKRFMVMDVTFADSRRSCCFTKSYGHYVEGTGSFLQLNRDVDGMTRDSVYRLIEEAHGIGGGEKDVNDDVDDEKDRHRRRHRIKTDELTEADLNLLRSLRLRYFKPSEIARLHCLSSAASSSSAFDFPASLTRKQRWKVLGNGLNAHVVAVLMRLLLMEGQY